MGESGRFLVVSCAASCVQLEALAVRLPGRIAVRVVAAKGASQLAGGDVELQLAVEAARVEAADERQLPAGLIDTGKAIQQVLSNKISDAQARLMTTLVTTDAGPSGGKAEAVSNAARAGEISATQAALHVLRYGQTTSQPDDTGDWQASAESLRAIMGGARAFVTPSSLSGLILQRAVEQYDAFHGSWSNADSILRSGLFAARATLETPPKNATQAAKAVLQGWQPMVDSWQPVTQAKLPGLAADARRAVGEVARMLPEGDVLRDYLTTQAKAYDDFHGLMTDGAAILNNALEQAAQQLDARTA